MTSRKLEKIQFQINAARGTPCSGRDLERIAHRLGRVRLTGAQSRGKEPTYKNVEFPTANMITIPQHGKRPVSPRTRDIILDQLEEDIFRWAHRLEQENQSNKKGGYENGEDK